jgi:hypothetical protein
MRRRCCVAAVLRWLRYAVRSSRGQPRARYARYFLRSSHVSCDNCTMAQLRSSVAASFALHRQLHAAATVFTVFTISRGLLRCCVSAQCLVCRLSAGLAVLRLYHGIASSRSSDRCDNY